MNTAKSWQLGLGATLAGAIACGPVDELGEKGQGELQSSLERAVLTDAEAASLEEPEMPVDVTLTARIEEGEVVGSRATRTELRIQASSPLESPKAALPTPAPEPKLNPLLTLDGSSSPINVMILYHSDLRIPRMPRLDVSSSRSSSFNVERLDRIERLIRWVESKRAPHQARREGVIAGLGGKVLSKFWLTDSLHVSIPANRLAEIALDPEVVSIGPETAGIPTVNDISTGRAMLNSDPYFNTAGLSQGYMGVIDSGVRSTHTLISNRLTWVRDCVNGTGFACTPLAGQVVDPSDGQDHGTGVASVMSANGNLGSPSRGVTQIMLDSFKVTSAFGGNVPAVQRAYQAAIAGGDNVINQSQDIPVAEVPAAADSAFDSGAVVVASVGNDGGTPANHIGYPAWGHKVIGVGALDQTKTRAAFSATGPTNDLRTKPDLCSLGVDTRWARFSSDTAIDPAVNGTSVAAPFVAGAAGLLRRWMNVAFGFSVEPGAVNAMLLAAGENRVSPAFNNSIGAGNLLLPTNASIHTGKITVTHQQTVDVGVSVGAGTLIDAAIWWPETVAQHNDIDVTLKTPAGSDASSSHSVGSIWEKVSKSSTTTGTWTVSIRGYSVSGTQTVYWALIRR